MKATALDAAIATVADKPCLVSFSGGKDSLVVMALAQQYASHVEAFAMYLVPGIRVFDDEIDKAEQRWGLKIRRYPHWVNAKYRNAGVYCFAPMDPVKLKLADIRAVARKDAGIDFVVTGAKRCDSLWRVRVSIKEFKKGDVAAPLWTWATRDVFDFLKARNIPIPPSEGGRGNGIGLTTPSLKWLHDEYPDDFARIEAAYPFCRAPLLRERWFGSGDPAERHEGDRASEEAEDG